MRRTSPAAAAGTSTVAIPSTAGRMRPRAARISRPPMRLTAASEKSSTHPWPVAASFAFGWAIFMVPAARKARASTAVMIQRTMFMMFFFRDGLGCSRRGRSCDFHGVPVVGEYFADHGHDLASVEFDGFEACADRLGTGSEDEVEATDAQRVHGTRDSAGDGLR